MRHPLTPLAPIALALAAAAALAGGSAAAAALAAGPAAAARHHHHRPVGFELVAGSANPRRVLFDGRRPIRVKYRFNARRRVDVAITIVRRSGGERRTVRRFRIRRARPGHAHVQAWAGKTGSGRAAPGGTYVIRVGRAGHRSRKVAVVRLAGHTFPVRGAHGSRGYIGEFGAPRTGGRTHEGFDITADCGTPIVAARGGRVLRTGYDPVLYGNYVLIKGLGERRSYLYAHMIKRPPVDRGRRVRTGRRIGSVGKTGNARTTPCHLHFELHRDGVPFDPLPYLHSWDRGSRSRASRPST